MKSEKNIIRREEMTDTVLELQNAASDSSVKVSDLLLKTLIVARKLKIVDPEPWIRFELEGYSDADANFFPSYRFLGDDIKCYYNRQYGNFVAIPSMLPKDGCDFYEKHLLRPLYGISVYEIERLLKYCTKDAEVDLPCPQCVEAAVKKLTGVPSPIILVFQEYSLTGILDAVRKKIFDWALNLEENGISGEEPPTQTGALESPNDMLTISEAAQYAGKCSRTIYNWRDKIDGDKPMLAGVTGKGRLTRIPRKSLTPYRKEPSKKTCQE